MITVRKSTFITLKHTDEYSLVPRLSANTQQLVVCGKPGYEARRTSKHTNKNRNRKTMGCCYS